jgi:hypothetical protein
MRADGAAACPTGAGVGHFFQYRFFTRLHIDYFDIYDHYDKPDNSQTKS